MADDALKTPADWLAKYYPVPADQVAEKDALDHSIRKWAGLDAKTLAEYGLVASSRALQEKNALGSKGVFRIDSDTCALCVHHLVETDTQAVGKNCTRCPLAIVRGDCPCDRQRKKEPGSPYGTWCSKSDPRPMLRWLKKAKAMVEKETHHG